MIADEATDSANDEQLPIIIRYLDKSVPEEKFLGFHECLSGVKLTSWQLDPHLLRGQAFDGVGHV